MINALDHNGLGNIKRSHRYLIKCNATGRYVGSTDHLGEFLLAEHCIVDTIGEDGLGAIDGRKGIPDFLRNERQW